MTTPDGSISTDPDHPTLVNVVNEPIPHELTIQKRVVGAVPNSDDLAGFSFTIARRGTTPPVATLITDAAGRTPVLPLPAGEYDVTETARPTWWPGEQPLPDPIEVSVPVDAGEPLVIEFENRYPTTTTTLAPTPAPVPTTPPPPLPTTTTTTTTTPAQHHHDHDDHRRCARHDSTGHDRPAHATTRRTAAPANRWGIVAGLVPSGQPAPAHGVGVVRSSHVLARPHGHTTTQPVSSLPIAQIGTDRDRTWRREGIVKFRDLDKLARRQHGVVERSQTGMSSSAWHRATASGQLIAMHRRVARLPGSADTAQQAMMAAVLAAGPGALVSHRSAAFLHGMAPARPTIVDLILPTSRTGLARARTASVRGLTGVAAHRPSDRRRLGPHRIDGIACTNVLRTMLDLGAVAPDLVPGAVGHALTNRLASLEAIETCLLEHGRPGAPGSARCGVPSTNGPSMRSPPIRYSNPRCIDWPPDTGFRRSSSTR